MKNNIVKYDFSDAKTRRTLWVGILLIIVIIACVIYGSDNEIKTHQAQVRVPVTKRDVDGKSLVTVYADFFVNGLKYTACDVVTGYESRNNFTIDVGDTVIVEYSYREPTINRLVFNKKYYK